MAALADRETPAAAQSMLPGDLARVTLKGIFNSPEFVAQRLGDARWLPGGDAYTTIDPSAVSPPGRDLVRYDAATGRCDLLVSASRLVPLNGATPLDVESYEWSPDDRQLLFYTNSQRVWRENTRGDYSIVNVANGRPRKLGGDAAPSTLMFATFSPDGGRVANVWENNVYVEGVAHRPRFTWAEGRRDPQPAVARRPARRRRRCEPTRERAQGSELPPGIDAPPANARRREGRSSARPRNS